MGAAAGARAWARAAGLGGGEANPTRPRSATIIPAPRFGRGGSIAGVDDSALRQRADLQALSAILLESWNELYRGMRTTRALSIDFHVELCVAIKKCYCC